MAEEAAEHNTKIMTVYRERTEVEEEQAPTNPHVPRLSMLFNIDHTFQTPLPSPITLVEETPEEISELVIRSPSPNSPKISISKTFALSPRIVVIQDIDSPKSKPSTPLRKGHSASPRSPIMSPHLESLAEKVSAGSRGKRAQSHTPAFQPTATTLSTESGGPLSKTPRSNIINQSPLSKSAFIKTKDSPVRNMVVKKEHIELNTTVPIVHTSHAKEKRVSSPEKREFMEHAGADHHRKNNNESHTRKRTESALPKFLEATHNTLFHSRKEPKKNDISNLQADSEVKAETDV
jgi:hypothetical protein